MPPWPRAAHCLSCPSRPRRTTAGVALARTLGVEPPSRSHPVPTIKPLSDRDVVRYLRLEEDEDTADLLLPTSVRYVGIHRTRSGDSHFWSYPTSAGVAWAELRSDGGLGIAEDVPQSVRDASSPREEHKMRKVAKRTAALPVAKRTPPDRAVWVSLPDLPACTATKLGVSTRLSMQLSSTTARR